MWRLQTLGRNLNHFDITLGENLMLSHQSNLSGGFAAWNAFHCGDCYLTERAVPPAIYPSGLFKDELIFPTEINADVERERERGNLANVRLTAPISRGCANIVMFFPLSCSRTELACVGNKSWEVILYGEMHYLCCRLNHCALLAGDRYSVCSSYGSQSRNNPKHFSQEFLVLTYGVLEAPCR